jgi:ABC-type Na+ efflux pump permease subunit
MHIPLLRYRLLEARHCLGWIPLVSLLTGVVLTVLTVRFIPLLPPAVNAFMERAFLIQGLGAVILLNAYIGIYLMVFFCGATGLMRALVEPRETRSLEMLLGKPLSRRAFLGARVTPLLLVSAAVGVVMTLTLGLVVRPFTGPHASVSVLGTLGSGLALTALAVLLLAVLVLPLLRVRDALQGLLVASVLWMVPMLPTAVLLYRPDLYEGRERLRELIALGPNLVWFDTAMPWVGVLAFLGAAVASWGLLALGARVFEHTDL